MASSAPPSTQASRDGRLRPVRNDDPLANIGLPSKGDTSLHDLREQERFFELILARDRLIDNGDDSETLTSRITNLSLSEIPSDTAIKFETPQPPTISKNDSRVQVLHHALRALRESLTAAHRTDGFAQNAYLSIVLIGVKHCIWETYLPTLLQLLCVLRRSQRIHLQDADIARCLQFEILDLACRQDDLRGAFEKWDAALHWATERKTQQAPTHITNLQADLFKIGQLLNALVHGNCILYWKMHRQLSMLHRGIMEYVAVRIRKEAVAALTKAYFSITSRYVESCFGMSYDEVVKEMDIRWEVEGEGDWRKVVIRRPRAAPAAVKMS